MSPALEGVFFTTSATCKAFFFLKGQIVNILDTGGCKSLLQLLNSAVVVLKLSHRQYVKKQVGPCSSETLFMDTKAF